MFKASLVLDAAIMGTFLALNTVTNLGNRDIWLTVTYFLVSASVIVLANIAFYFFIYRHSKQQTI